VQKNCLLVASTRRYADVISDQAPLARFQNLSARRVQGLVAKRSDGGRQDSIKHYRSRPLALALTTIFLVVTATAYEYASTNSAHTVGKNVLPNAVTYAQQQGNASALPAPYEHWTGDLDGMIKRRETRALVVYSRTAFFYDHGRPEGISYEALQEFQQALNREFRTGNLPVTVTFLPVGYDDLEQALISGLGDLVAIPVAITPERRQKVAFSAAIATVRQIIISGPSGPAVTSLDDLSGKEIFVNPLSVYPESLLNLNKSLESKGKKPVVIRSADKNLGDEDLLEMVNAGLLPATVTINLRAQFWAKVFDHLHLCSECVLSNEEQLAWAMRKDSPKLKKFVDEFVETHREGTSFGNTLLRRYLQNTKWVENITTDAEMRKFRLYVEFFKKYAAQYDFDYLMLVALGYQESGLNQDRRNPTGALGIMQVIPKYAAASPIDIPSVDTAEPNIHAGTKMLREIEDRYFRDQRVDALNKTLFTFASYNAGPVRIAALRQQAQREGLNPDVWFENVEFVVAREIGQETVRYVSNIYKYYVAYKLVLEQAKLREKEMHSQ
jgi:membrane-bound lytic murein transglycosylase MltF